MKVRNRGASVVGYKIPDLNIRRRFAPGEIKEIPEEELKQLLYQPGGRELLVNFLQVKQDDVKKIDLEEQEKEYYYSDEKVKEIVLSGSLDEFLDTLDFAPEGVINLIKKYAVSLPMTDLNKIKALQEKTGFNSQVALENTSGIEEIAAAPKRRVQEDKYKVIADN